MKKDNSQDLRDRKSEYRLLKDVFCAFLGRNEKLAF